MTMMRHIRNVLLEWPWGALGLRSGESEGGEGWDSGIDGMSRCSTECSSSQPQVLGASLVADALQGGWGLEEVRGGATHMLKVGGGGSV